jgi:hypothetical protein
MASDTVPAAAGTPDDPAAPLNAPTTGVRPGRLIDSIGGLLAATEPARPTPGFTITPTLDAAHTTTADGGPDQPVTGATSAAYDDPNTPAPDGKNGSTSRKETSVVRAWLLAGAERWKQGGVARNKRLDYLKVKAAANQVKVTRQESVNNSGSLLGNSGGASSGKNGSGKSPGSKGAGGAGLKGPKNSSGASRNTSAGRSGGSGSGSGKPTGGKDSGSSSAKGPNSNRSAADSGGSPKRSKADGPKSAGGAHSGSASDSGSSRKGKRPGAGTQHATARETPFVKDDTKGSSGKGSGTKDSADGKGGKGETGKAGAPGKDAARGPKGASGTDVPAGKTTDAPGATPPKKDASKTPSPKADLGKPGDSTGKDPKVGKDAGENANPKAKTGTDSTGDTKNTGPGKTPGTPNPDPKGPARGLRLDLRGSREAGYRDGTRAAKTVAHVEAWRDGVRDGWTDTRKAADREHTRLDKAHADRKQQRPEDKPVNPSSTDQPDTASAGPRPITVTGIDATHVHLGDGASRPSLRRGEVRTLRGFQKALDTKADTMTRIAEATRGLAAHATEQAKQATHLLEQAKSIEGGEKLVAALTRLVDDATAQAAKAEEIHKRAVRAAENATVVHANAETRYGPIYKAIQNSPETSVPELNYFREMADA